MISRCLMRFRTKKERISCFRQMTLMTSVISHTIICFYIWFIEFAFNEACTTYIFRFPDFVLLTIVAFYHLWHFTGTKLRDFSDYKLGISIPTRRESSDLLNAEGDKNDYDWLVAFCCLFFIIFGLKIICNLELRLFLETNKEILIRRPF